MLLTAFRKWRSLFLRLTSETKYSLSGQPGRIPHIVFSIHFTVVDCHKKKCSYRALMLPIILLSIFIRSTDSSHLMWLIVSNVFSQCHNIKIMFWWAVSAISCRGLTKNSGSAIRVWGFLSEVCMMNSTMTMILDDNFQAIPGFLSFEFKQFPRMRSHLGKTFRPTFGWKFTLKSSNYHRLKFVKFNGYAISAWGLVGFWCT
jgi:hypothetical protein